MTMQSLSKRLGAVILALSLLAGLQGCAALATGAVLGTGTVVAVDRRTTGTMVDDQANEMQITDAIYRDDELGKKVHIKVTSFNRMVLLTGEAPTKAMRDRAIALVRQQPGVDGIYDEVRIAPPSSSKTRLRDRWITAKIKSKLLADNAKPLRNKVVTTDGTVYLMGLVKAAEAEKAVTVTRRVGGVRRVVTLYNYLDQTPTYAEAEPSEKKTTDEASLEAPQAGSGAVAIPYSDTAKGPAFVRGD